MQAMKVLIYGTGSDADAILQREREAGHRASLRNPEPHFFNASAPEKADAVHAWHSHIWHAYVDKAEINYHGHLITDEEAIAANDGVDVTEVKTTPIKRTRKK